MIMKFSRREMLAGIGGLSGSLVLGSTFEANMLQMPQSSSNVLEVTAVEDLMREHGVLRRALMVYSEAAARLKEVPLRITTSSLRKTAQLFRSVGEDYHEKQLEETYIFPRVRKSGGISEAYVNVFLAQHQRGRQITDYIVNATRFTAFETGNVPVLILALESMVRMYRAHTAREDTIVFPAWKQTMEADEYDKLGDKFEEIEQKSLGSNGFEKAVQQISEIEAEIGISDLASFTALLPQSIK
jgi:hemerythrin-like domain-containing protein